MRASDGSGARASSSSLSRSRPSSRRISPSACSPVRSIASKARRESARSWSSMLRPPRACTTTTAIAWAITSCNSRAIRCRSSTIVGLRLRPSPVRGGVRAPGAPCIITPASHGPPMMKSPNATSPHMKRSPSSLTNRATVRAVSARADPGPGTASVRAQGVEGEHPGDDDERRTLVEVGREQLDQREAGPDGGEGGERVAAAERERQRGEGRGQAQSHAMLGVGGEPDLDLDPGAQCDGERDVGVDAECAPDTHRVTVRHAMGCRRRSGGRLEDRRTERRRIPPGGDDRRAAVADTRTVSHPRSSHAAGSRRTRNVSGRSSSPRRRSRRGRGSRARGRPGSHRHLGRSLGDQGTREFLVVCAIIAVAAAVVFGWLVPRYLERGTTGTPALVLSTLALVTVVGFWTGLPPILAAGGGLLGWGGLSAERGQGRCRAAIAIAVLALIADVVDSRARHDERVRTASARRPRPRRPAARRGRGRPAS